MCPRENTTAIWGLKNLIRSLRAENRPPHEKRDGCDGASVSIPPSALQPSVCPPSARASSVAAMYAAATALVFRNQRMRQWQLFIVANIVHKGEVWGGVPPFRTTPQCSTYFDQSGFGKLANLQALQVHESKLIVQTFPKKGMVTFRTFRYSRRVPKFWCQIHVCPSYYFIFLNIIEIKSHLLPDKVILWAVRDNNKKQKNTWSCNVQFRKWRRRKKFLIFAKRDVHILRGRRTHPAPILSLEYSELTSNWTFLANTIL